MNRTAFSVNWMGCNYLIVRTKWCGNWKKRDVYNSVNVHIHKFWGVIDKRAQKIWKSKMPMRLRVFVWQALHNKLQAGVVLKRINWKGNERCPLCNTPENGGSCLFPMHHHKLCLFLF